MCDPSPFDFCGNRRLAILVYASLDFLAVTNSTLQARKRSHTSEQYILNLCVTKNGYRYRSFGMATTIHRTHKPFGCLQNKLGNTRARGAPFNVDIFSFCGAYVDALLYRQVPNFKHCALHRPVHYVKANLAIRNMLL